MSKIFNKKQKNYIQTLREIEQLTYTEIAVKAAKKFKTKNDVKFYNRIKKCGYRSKKVLPLVETEANVEELLRRKIVNGKKFYQVKWESSQIKTWEPLENLTVSPIVAEMATELDETYDQ